MAEGDSDPENNFTFHRNHGALVQLSENRLTAFRQRPSHEFNQGLVFSNKPLKNDEVFEVRIDRKVHSWTGSLQIGVVTQDPATLTPAPSNALDILNKSWVLSGCNLFENGKKIIEDYGPDLDELNDGDRVGVMRTKEGDLVFFVNSFTQGVAISGIPSTIYGVVDLYGKCIQATVMNPKDINKPARPALTLSTTVMDSYQQSEDESGSYHQWEEESSNVSTPNLDRLRFHHRCGSMVKLSSNQRTGERRRPMDEFNNGVVMTQRPLLPDEIFEIQIESLVDKWSGSIEVGITTHNPTALEFPSTMTNLRSGTIMMSGCGILTNGRGTRREYGHCNLDELAEGDTIGLVRHSSGDLHFFVNGRDQGIAASNVPQPVWGVVDLYGRTVKVSLIDRDDVVKRPGSVTPLVEDTSIEPLQFHPRCGLHAAVVNGGITAHRPNAQSDFNHGVVLTNRPLRPNELFEVVLDQIVLKWAGSIEIGVTIQRPEDLDYPATMTNIRSGTWMMTGNGVMHNGITILDDYGTSLDRLCFGDRVGVMRRANGILHFYVNGEDQGAASAHIPANVYGVVDLYGQAAQVSIVDHSPSTPPTDSSTYPSNLYKAPSHFVPLVSPTSFADSTYALPSPNSLSTLHRGATAPLVTYTDLTFHRLHGQNTTLTNNGMTASRPNALSEFNDAIVMTSRPLRPGEMFEVVIEKLVKRWSGSLELGVTAIPPENLDFPSTMTDIDYETWMLSGSSVMQVGGDGTITRNGYSLDLDALSEGNRVGLLRHADKTLHYYLDGEDQGVACWNIPEEVYAVIDLYGQCAQVSLSHQPLQAVGIPDGLPSPEVVSSYSVASLASGNQGNKLNQGNKGNHHHLSALCGKSIQLLDDFRMAQRDEKDFENGLIFSSSPLLPDESFDLQIESISKRWAGSIAVGLTSFIPVDGAIIPPSIDELEGSCYLSGSHFFNGQKKLLKSHLAPNLERLRVGDIISIQKTVDSTLKFALNGNDLGASIKNIPPNAYVVIDLHGIVQSVSIKSMGRALLESTAESLISPTAVVPSVGSSLAATLPLSLSQLALREAMQGINAALNSRFRGAFSNRFHENHGRNIVLRNNGQAALRTASYNQGVVYSKEPLSVGSYFQVKIEELDQRWSDSLMIGVTGQPVEKLSSPMSALLMKRQTWVICGDALHHEGRKIRTNLNFNLNQLEIGQSVGVYLHSTGYLHILIDGTDQGSVLWVGTDNLHAVIDLYGMCVQVSTLSSSRVALPPPGIEEKALRESANSEKYYQLKTDAPPQQSCRFRQNCARFICLMGLPEAYLESEGSSCGCDVCYTASASERGDGKADIPEKGWCRMVVKNRYTNICIDGSTNEKWQRAYHGTRPSITRRILDEGHLLPPDLSIWQRSRNTRSCKDHDGDSEGCQLLFSPLLNPASTAAPPAEFFDPVLKANFRGQMVLQVLIQPGSYKVCRATSPLNLTGATSMAVGPINTTQQLSAPSTEDGAIFWYTKERGAAIVQALLVRTEVTTE